MTWAIFIKKSGVFLKNNWKLIAVIFGILLVTGILRRLIGRIQMIIANRKAVWANKAGTIDWDFLAMSVHNALYQGLFNMGENENEVISLVNSLDNEAEFLNLARVYAKKYNKDLREQIRKNFSDSQYKRLNYR